jgi:ribosomal protein L19E
MSDSTEQRKLAAIVALCGTERVSFLGGLDGGLL